MAWAVGFVMAMSGCAGEPWRVVVTAGDLSGEVVIDAPDGSVHSSIMGIAN